MSGSSTTLDRYRLLYLLGEGGMGQVHLASAQGAAGFEKLVALKVLGPKYASDRERTRRLLREAVIGVRLDHANVVQILDLGETDDSYFIAMEYVRGFALSEVIDHARRCKDPIPVRTVCHVARCVLAALEYVHDFEDIDGNPLGLIHGDVTPSNVLLGYDGRVKLSDFGVAILEREASGGVKVAGKLAFLPPEAFHGVAAVPSWDLYALAASLYEAIACQPAYSGSTLAELRASRKQGYPPIASLRSDCPAALAEVLDRALAKDPAQRFTSAPEMRAALDQACERRLDDEEHHRDYVQEVFADQRFVSSHGELPTTGGLRTPLPLTPPLHRTIADDVTAMSVPQQRKVLRFGLSPALGADLARRFGDRLTDYIGERVERDVRDVVFADYRTLVEALVSGEVDIAWMPPFAFIAAAEQAAGALVVSVRFGRPTYDSGLFVRDDSPIQTLADLRGKRAAWIERESASGYQFPAAEIIRHVGKLDEVLSEQHFFGSHRQACEAVLNGWADVGGTYASRDDTGKLLSAGWIDTLGDRAGEIRALAFAGPIPCDNIAHRPHLPDKIRTALIDVFRAMTEDDDGRELLREVFNADEFGDVELAAYDTVRSRLLLI